MMIEQTQWRMGRWVVTMRSLFLRALITWWGLEVRTLVTVALGNRRARCSSAWRKPLLSGPVMRILR